MSPELLLARAEALLAGPVGPAVVLGLGLLVVALLVALWLRGRAGGDAAQDQELRAARNEARLHKGDLIQARRELETLRAVAGGKVPPELEAWKQRAERAEASLKTELDALKQRHKVELERLGALVGGSMDKTMIAPSTAAARETLGRLERELAEAKEALAAADAERQAALEAQAERLGTAKVAALTAQAARHAAELARAQRQPGGVTGPAALDVAGLDAPREGLRSALFPYLEAISEPGAGTRHQLAYDVTTIGRAAQNQIQIDDPRAGREHAEIRFNGREFVIHDNQSVNGTLVNDRPVAGSAPLAFGDVIGIGETRLRFTCAAAASQDLAFKAEAFAAMRRLAPGLRAASNGEPAHAAAVAPGGPG